MYTYALVIGTFVVIAAVIYFLTPPINENTSNDKDASTRKPKTEFSAEDIAWDQLPDEFVIFDLETTGLKSNKIPVDIIEISAIKVIKDQLRNGHDVETFTALVKPVRGGLNPEATAVNGITQKMIDNDGEDIADVLNQFIEFTGDRLLVAYNVDFDRWFLNRELQEQGIKKRYKYECAYLIARKAFPTLQNHKLTTVASKLGIDTSGSHRALADCLMTMHVYLWGKTFTKDGKDIFDAILPFEVEHKPELVGTDVVFTGTLSELTRDQAERLAESAGMTVKSAISKKVEIIVVGDNPGSKLNKANELGIKIITEKEFIELIT
jgi:DNA polymerase III epsilon subunit family exonuclease